MADAFISYRRTPSSQLAMNIQTRLQSTHNLDIYLDINRSGGTTFRYPNRLVDAIKDAPVFICLLGERGGNHTLESEWVLKEIQIAYDLRKFCVPVFQESYRPLPDMPPAVHYLLGFDSVHIFDQKNIMIDSSVQMIADLTRTHVKLFDPVETVINALTTPNKTLFLSYSRKQTDWCDDLYTAIDTYTHFQRWRDNKIPESADWWNSICVNIEGCFAFVAILTQDYLNSIYCMGELEYALKLKKPVIALMLQDVTYPQKLNEQRLQFARVGGLAIPQVINKVLSATNQITIGYMQDDFSTDIHPRKHLRPRVPTPQATTPTPEEERQRQRMKQITGEYDDLAHYITTARSAAARKAIQRFMTAYPDYGDPQDLMQKFRPKAIELLPKPFAWVEIPENQKIDVFGQDRFITNLSAYWVAKYPVTNAQFAKFIEADGYNTKRWWTDAGWQQREKDGWTEPRYWTDSKWNGAEQPVVGVSWYEAVAFCLWLSEVTGEKIMLPTEAQWQYAAQGDDGRTYPWGNDWDCERCNNSVNPCDSNVTTPVRQYERTNASPFGVVDMAGNIWEWCLTDYENRTNSVNSIASIRVLRSGSWDDNDTDLFRCDLRNGNVPFDGFVFGGFRISRS